MLMFHGCLVHGSPSNMSPWNRVIVYLSLCAVSNHIRKAKRPPWIAHRNFTPVRPLPDDCLLRDDIQALPWPGHEVDEEAQQRGEGAATWTADSAEKADEREAALL